MNRCIGNGWPMERAGEAPWAKAERLRLFGKTRPGFPLRSVALRCVRQLSWRERSSARRALLCGQCGEWRDDPDGEPSAPRDERRELRGVRYDEFFARSDEWLAGPGA